MKSPKHHPQKLPQHRNSSGIALILVLGVIVLLAIIIVTLTFAMRVERTTTGYYTDRLQAEALASEAVEAAKAAIISATAATTGRSWSAGPGYLISWSGPNPDAAEVVPLHSGNPGGTADSEFDLNRSVLSDDGLPALTGSASAAPRNVGWIYVLADGTRLTSPPGPGGSSDVIGRYAFWTDPETTRINLNSAWMRDQPASVPPSHPSRLPLDVLPGMTEADANALHVASQAFPFTSPAEPSRLSPTLADLISANRDSITALSWNRDTNPWNEEQFVLTTQANLAHGRKFLDILATPNSDPGDPQNIQFLNQTGGKTQGVIRELVEVLNRSDWPYADADAGGIGDKFSSQPGLVAQLAVDIVEYVRAAESRHDFLPGVIRGQLTSGGEFESGSAFGANALLGSSRTPYITELALWIGESPLPVTPTRLNATTYEGRFLIELHLPDTYGGDPIPIDSFTVQHDVDRKTAPVASGGRLRLTADMVVEGPQQLEAGGYTVVAVPFEAELGTTRNTRTSLEVRAALLNSGVPGNLVTSAPINSIQGARIICPINPPQQSFEVDALRSMEVSDPRVGTHVADWVANPSTNTFGAQNSNFVSGQSEPASPPRDGAGAEAALRLPHPKGSAANPLGIVDSVAALGVVPTGRFGAVLPGVPWRTIRLRPSTASGPDVLPDWAITELFVAPLPPASPPPPALNDQPRPDATAGRINLNSGASLPTFLPPRDIPLLALVSGIPAISSAEAVQNILARETAPNGRLLNPEGYVARGELCEILGIGGPNEAAELPLRSLLDHATTQSETFRITATAQSLRQSANGEFTILAEKSVSAVVERTETSCQTLVWQSIPF